MLKEKIDLLYHLLECSNSDIARCLSCSPSTISRLHSQARQYSPSSKTVFRFSEGVYLYALQKNRLDQLCSLCRCDNKSRSALVSALILWLYDSAQVSLDHLDERIGSSEPFSIRQQTFSFGDKLDKIMNTLDLSNVRLARIIQVDTSAISRFRNGVRCPKSPISGLLVSALLSRIQSNDRIKDISAMTGIPTDLLAKNDEETAHAFSLWLYANSSSGDSSGIDSLLSAIDQFLPSTSPPLTDLEVLAPEEILNSRKNDYWGKEGLREAVIRFLGNAAKSGGELWLYSDEDIDWMVSDPLFHARWKSLMAACIRNRVRIRIVHNINRNLEEMLAAIQSWMPLYMSGLIEPYVCRLDSDARFLRTIFLHRGRSCISSSPFRKTKGDIWYEYLTDSRKLAALEDDYRELIKKSNPLLQVSFGGSEIPLPASSKTVRKSSALLGSLSLATMPEELFLSMLGRSELTDEQKERLSAFYRQQKRDQSNLLQIGEVHELLSLPSDEMLFSHRADIRLAPFLKDLELAYTPDEYAWHIEAVISLLRERYNYSLCLLPELPFSSIQIICRSDSVIVIRSERPYVTFIFTEPRMIHAFEYYFDSMRSRFQEERAEVESRLKRFL